MKIISVKVRQVLIYSVILQKPFYRSKQLEKMASTKDSKIS